jgi:predicted DCC family thiol-disulfide oxidoreductase YuxK
MVLSFDCICLLCSGFVRLLARHGRLQYASSGSAAGAAIFLASGQAFANPATVILVDGSQPYVEFRSHYPIDKNARRRLAARGSRPHRAGIPARCCLPFRSPKRFRRFGGLEHCPVLHANLGDRLLA